MAFDSDPRDKQDTMDPMDAVECDRGMVTKAAHTVSMRDDCSLEVSESGRGIAGASSDWIPRAKEATCADTSAAISLSSSVDVSRAADRLPAFFYGR